MPATDGRFSMDETRVNDVTLILQAARDGDRDAADRLLPLVYDELRKLARSRLARLPPGQTLQPTALVHEAYLRLLGKSDLHLESRKHFFFAAARAMHDILVEQARAKAGPKRGGGRRRIELSDELADSGAKSADVLTVSEAVRFFAGMNAAEAAAVLGLSERTLHRQWRFIKAWLQSHLE
jgi:RNA polymerase sigma factor (TIGR02999 family)